MSDRSPDNETGEPVPLNCLGKVKFETKALADTAAVRRSGRCVYRCGHCRQWHVGTPFRGAGRRQERKHPKEARRRVTVRIMSLGDDEE